VTVSPTLISLRNEAGQAIEQDRANKNMQPRAAKRCEAVPLDMSRIYPDCPDSDASNQWLAADLLFRQDPDEEEDEEDDDDDDGEEDEEDDDEDTDDGYSE